MNNTFTETKTAFEFLDRAVVSAAIDRIPLPTQERIRSLRNEIEEILRDIAPQAQMAGRAIRADA